MIDKFSEGDLVYIPQAVMMWSDETQNNTPYLKTERPTTGVCLTSHAIINPKTNDRLIQIYAKGQSWAVQEKDVYLMDKKGQPSVS